MKKKLLAMTMSAAMVVASLAADIVIAKRLLEQYEKQKQYLLRQMFI